ncbi:hypothetical protein [Halorubrum sp. N11]|uniref:hypothetical protein n=1 Tax=Halorubrum sp. N11 TaxID=3402276 RepID=UPI003EBF69EC
MRAETPDSDGTVDCRTDADGNSSPPRCTLALSGAWPVEAGPAIGTPRFGRFEDALSVVD